MGYERWPEARALLQTAATGNRKFKLRPGPSGTDRASFPLVACPVNPLLSGLPPLRRRAFRPANPPNADTAPLPRPLPVTARLTFLASLPRQLRLPRR